MGQTPLKLFSRPSFFSSAVVRFRSKVCEICLTLGHAPSKLFWRPSFFSSTVVSYWCCAALSHWESCAVFINWNTFLACQASSSHSHAANSWLFFTHGNAPSFLFCCPYFSSPAIVRWWWANKIITLGIAPNSLVICPYFFSSAVVLPDWLWYLASLSRWEFLAVYVCGNSSCAWQAWSSHSHTANSLSISNVVYQK